MDIAHFFRTTAHFNQAFRSKLGKNIGIYEDTARFIAYARMISCDFAAPNGYATPHSNQIVVGLLQRTSHIVEIQVQRGPLIIATALIDFQDLEQDKFCSLTVQTNPLSMYNVYPLHVFEHEPDDFFQQCGYGRLSLYFSLLYTVTAGMGMAILCDNPITAYILFVLFGSGSARAQRGAHDIPLPVDVSLNVPLYLQNMSQQEVVHGRIHNYQDFYRIYSQIIPDSGSLIYRVHATGNNSAVITQGIEHWISQNISGLSDEAFMAMYFRGPKLRHYHGTPSLQDHYPQFSHRYIVQNSTQAPMWQKHPP